MPKIIHEEPKWDYIALDVKHYYEFDFVDWMPKSCAWKMAYNSSLKAQFSSRSRLIEP